MCLNVLCHFGYRSGLVSNINKLFRTADYQNNCTHAQIKSAHIQTHRIDLNAQSYINLDKVWYLIQKS